MLAHMTRLRGVFAAAVTPLIDGGTRLDEPGVARVADFLAEGGADGAPVCGTAGEGMLLTVAERLSAAARACDPLPFTIYAFTARSGYPIPLSVIERLGERAPNLAGLKVSEVPWERFEPYLIDGLDIFVGPEALIQRGLAGGAIGAISALASAFPELVAAAVHTGTPEATARAAEARAAVERFPMPAALKTVCALRGVPISGHVRAPLRALDSHERAELEQVVRGLLEVAAA
jgi:dihydrodipicolinate synthase/N-acetylneuraminate lyase